MIGEQDTFSLFPNVVEKSEIKSTILQKTEAVTNIFTDNIANKYWEECLKIIKDNVQPQVFRTWFEPINAIKCENNQLLVSVPSQFFVEWIEEQYYPLLCKTLEKVMGEGAKLQYRVTVANNLDAIENRTIRVQGLRFPPSAPLHNGLPFETHIQKNKVDFPNYLNPRYTFDNFVQGESNQLACSAGLAIAKNPGKTRFNPLVVYGDTGLGKTHLVHGIGNLILKNFRNARALYTTSERFTHEFIDAIQNNKVNDFNNFYRSVDVLIVDDIQFFGKKEKTQDSFFHTFNALYQSGKQLILISDKPPRELIDVDERLISRFQWGLTADIQSPDYEMRVAILQKKSFDEGFELPSEIIEYIARNVKSSVRELEGSLISLIAKVTLDRKELNLALAQEVVHGIAHNEPKPITIDLIKDYVAAYYKLPTEKLASKSRKHEISLARQMAIYLSKKLTQNSLKSIGSHFGNRDHSTILHSCQSIDNYLGNDANVKIAYEAIMGKLTK